MNYSMDVEAILLVILMVVIFLLISAFGLLLERFLQFYAKKLYHKQTQQAIAEVLGRPLG